MATALLALSAVFIGLRATGTELNISSMMGMTMILGIVTEVAIFLVWEFRTLPAHLGTAEALIEAGRLRMRAIVMSTLAAILALSPLALGLGQGAAMQRPLAIAIISGMLFQLPLVFLVMPVLFVVLGVRRDPEGQE
jgi:multidrug efflux pump subunit AcrB